MAAVEFSCEQPEDICPNDKPWSADAGDDTRWPEALVVKAEDGSCPECGRAGTSITSDKLVVLSVDRLVSEGDGSTRLESL